MALALFMAAALLSAPGDLVFVEGDFRDSGDMAWVDEAVMVHLESDCFLAILGDLDPESFDWTLVEEAPVDLNCYRILYRAQAGEGYSALPGEVVIETGRFILLRLPEPVIGPVEVPGAGFLRPLKAHHRRLLLPCWGSSSVDTALVDEIVAAVLQDSIQSYISHMESYGTRYMTSPEYAACADWADTWIEAHGVFCELQTFSYSGVDMSNVVAEIPGTVNPDDIYIICGHLDSYCANPLTAPGADDNASGSAAVLEAVRVMAPYTYANTVRFVLFAAEEAWMVGSEYYVQQAYQAGDNILGAINLDMVLYAPYAADSIYIPYDDQSEPLALAAGEMFARYSPDIFTRVTYDPGAPSDHASFWQYGYTAIEVAEANVDEIWGGYNPNYHQPTDLLSEYLPFFPYGTDAIRASIGLFAALADPLGPSGIETSPAPQGTVRVFPNPARGGHVSISPVTGGIGGAQYLVMDLTGRMAGHGELDGTGCAEFDISSLPGGVYSVVFPDGGIEPARFVLLK
ncbi:MAG TPA: M28 family peptidase [Candidatus Sabulitectum sp.]|nr:M28 family peptidase [Candidatus Sabulitectum sp.]HPJ28900.1 M28 family peptidase [Candidatus Sabulitectum sp.]